MRDEGSRGLLLPHPSSLILHPFSQGNSSQAGNLFAGPQIEQALDRRLDQVDRVRAAVCLRQNVVDAARFEYVAHAGAGLDPAVVAIMAAIERRLGNALALGCLG